MKILFLTDGLFPFIVGGMQKHSSILVKLLIEKGIQVHLVHPGGDNYSNEKLENFVGKNFSGNLEETVIDFPQIDSFPGHYIRENKLYSKRAYLALKDKLENFDLIYAQGFTGWYFLRNKTRNSIPIIVNFHGYGEFQKSPSFLVSLQYILLRPLMRKMTINADFVYSFGGLIDEIILSIGTRQNKILQHANGIESTWLVDNPSTHIARSFIFVGRSEKRKGMGELITALRMLSKKEDFHFHFVGAIPLNERIENQHFYYHGEIRDENKIREIFDQCDCLVCPSYAEGMPTVILEAMARGLAIIATDVGAVSRLIDGNGILLANPDVLKLRDAIETIIALSEPTLMTMKRRSLELVKENFLWPKVIDAKIEDFKMIIAEKN